ncbi:MAG: phenylalanine--tRNA ligase subunit beta [Bacteroidales bacterium]
MKVAYSWLKEYADLNLNEQETSELLTDCGLEIDAVEKYESVKGGLQGLVVGSVLTCVDHPDSDHLHITTVDIGSEILDIVCGAPNVEAGQKVIVATVGTVLYSDKESFVIKKSRIRGRDSFGMICAEDEIGMGKSHDGIMILPSDIPVGMPACEYFKVQKETVFEIGLTPNRSDATSHLGVVRDLVSLVNIRQGKKLKIKYPSVEDFKLSSVNLPITVSVEDFHACPRYTGVTIKGVKVSPSPQWMQQRLQSIGLRPINNIVDITNFVLMETGQPLHAFDVAQITGQKIIVRSALQGEKFVTLDGVERVLSEKNLMICNEKEPMCIAGVLGGIQSGVRNTTTDVFIESAYFNPVSIRKTAKEHGLNTDASFRYERGADPHINEYALKRAALLICEIAGGEVASPIIDLYPEPIPCVEIELSMPYLRILIGKDLSQNLVQDILESLEMQVKKIGEDKLLVRVPANKADVTRPADLVEEVLRIYGYNNIELSGHLSYAMNMSITDTEEEILVQVSNLLANKGFLEIMNNSLCGEEYVAGCGMQADCVSLANPLSKELNILRPTLLFGGMESIALNLNHKQNNLRFYEFGRTYFKNTKVGIEKKVTEKYKEEMHLSMFLSGCQEEETWQYTQQKSDFYFLKKQVEIVSRKLRLDSSKYQTKEVEGEEFQYGLQYEINEKPIVRFGKIKPSICKYFDVKQDVFYADFHWDTLLKYRSHKKIEYMEIAKYPSVRRDLALLLDPNITFLQIKEISKKSEKTLLKEINLFDVYEGNKIPAGKKSYAVSFVFQDINKTLTDNQVEKIMEKIQLNLNREIGAVLR